MKRLYKSRDKMLAGVCAGVAEYFDLDPTVVRLATAFFTLITGIFPLVILYIIAAIIMPEKTGSQA